MLLTHSYFLRTAMLSAVLAATSFAQTGTFTSMSMASYAPIVSPDSIAAGFGTNLAATTASATTMPPPTMLGNVQVTITDSSGAKLPAPLYLVSPTQINYVIPATTALGKATVNVSSGTAAFQGTLLISNVAPALVSAANDGKGAPAGQIVRVTTANVLTLTPTFLMGSNSTFTPAPINLSSAGTDKFFVMFYGTGVRRHSLNPVFATVGGVRVPVTYAGAQSQYTGLDQVNIGPLPATLAGKGQVNVVLTVDGVPGNTVVLAVQ